MIDIRIIPSLLIKNNRVVKGVKFSNHKDAGDPITTCLALESQLADEICIIDLDAYEQKRSPNIDYLKNIVSKISTPITYGGNITNIDEVRKIITNGADKVIINYDESSDDLINEIANKFGRQSITAAVDLIKENNSWKIFKNKKIINTDHHDYIKFISKKRIGEIKITFVSNEGMRTGFDLVQIKQISNLIKTPIIFEGGLGSLSQINEAINHGAKSIAIGTMIIFSDNNIFKIKQYLKNENQKIRF